VGRDAIGWLSNLDLIMGNYPHSLVVICPAEVRGTLIGFGAAIGVSAGMVVELSADGSAPPTHYGSHSWAGPDFVAIMTGQVTPEIDGVSEAEIAAVLGQCTVSVDPVVDDQLLTKAAHFDHVAASLGLQRIIAEI
jgi:hypothetical protein